MSGRPHGRSRRGRRARRAASPDWLAFQARLIHPDQIAYEEVRPVAVLGQDIKARAAELGVSPKTLSARVQRFVQFGIPGLVPHAARRADDGRLLPAAIQDHIVLLKAQHPPLTPTEIAAICAIRFDRAVNHSTVRRVLARSSLPKVIGRRFPRFHAMADGEERREAMLRLHLEGWPVIRIAEYLGVSRKTVTAFLRHRWIEDGVAGLADKSRARRPGARKSTLAVTKAVKELQASSAIGAHRMAAALKQRGYDVSPRTCGRIMAINRELYRLPTPPRVSRAKKPMPFAASRAHEVWSVDIRYIEHHQVPGVSGPIYVITILDNYSRSILASAPSVRQDEDAYLLVLFTAIHLYGAPEVLVSDGGGVFRSNHALEIYEQLGIRKERITPRRPWQNYVETHFAIMKRMADYRLERAPSWEAFCAVHARFVADYNCQEHFAHQDRPDKLHAPQEVLRWLRGHHVEQSTLERLFFTRHTARRLGRTGYIRYQNWRLYGEEGLAGEQACVWLMKETLTIAFEDDPLAQYSVTYRSDGRTLKEVGEEQPIRALRARHPSPQPPLWAPDAVEWRKVLKLPPYMRRQRQAAVPSGWAQPAFAL